MTKTKKTASVEIMNHKDAEKTETGQLLPISQEKKDLVLKLLSEGKSMLEVESALGRSRKSITSWFEKNDEEMALFLNAKRQKLKMYLEELVKIADDPEIDPRQKKHMLNVRMWQLEKLDNDIVRQEDRTLGGGNINVNAPQGMTLNVSFAKPVKDAKEVEKILEVETEEVDG